MKRTIFVALCVILIALGCSCAPAEPHARAEDGSYAGMPGVVDSHLHYLDFIQQSDGFEKLVERMDEAGVDKAVVFGMAMAKQWDEDAAEAPAYYLSDDSRCYYYSGTDHILLNSLAQQPDEIRDRFYPFICGVNPNDRYAASQLRALLEMYPGQIYGIGELMSRHDDLTALTYGEPPRADHPALLEVYDLAAEYDIPVLIHHNISSVNNPDPLYLGEMKNALAHNRKTRIIWAHVGISRRITVVDLPDIAEDMLRSNPNLYYDISWIVYEEYIAKDEASLDKWAELIEKYPDRFMIGSDKVGHWDTYPGEITKYAPLVARLSPDTAWALCSENILLLVDPEAVAESLKEAA